MLQLPDTQVDLIVNGVLVSYGLTGEYTLNTKPLSPGTHDFEVKIRDTKTGGNVRILKVPDVEAGKIAHADFKSMKKKATAVAKAPAPTPAPAAKKPAPAPAPVEKKAPAPTIDPTASTSSTTSVPSIDPQSTFTENNQVSASSLVSPE